MFPDKSFREGATALDDFYRLYLIPGAGHCAVNDFQPNGQWPQTTLQKVIAWVENGTAPATLPVSGPIKSLCRWPSRPLWTQNGTKLNCVYDQDSVNSFIFDLDAYKLPVY